MTHYDTLNINKNATYNEIKKAFRNLSFKYHPDKCGTDDKFKKITFAYQILSDETKKQEYDRTLRFNKRTNDQEHSCSTSSTQIVPLITINVDISLNESFSGCNKPIEIERIVLENNISSKEKEVIYVEIKKGIDNNEFILIKDKGNIINGVKGDLKLIINLINNSKLTRKGLDLYFYKSITLRESLCGFTFDLPYFDNKSLKINNYKKIIEPNYSQVLKNMGMQREDYVGNLIIQFDVLFPNKLDKSQKNNLNNILQ